ncbi:hypothetical protein [Baekduia sp. Peel2402]|uniref:hypothetical protein n=1 Tax=Baekduia sp. Peel2402 TaxID=3458296 RepID=UPI00403E7F19
MTWGLIWLMLVLKIPVAALLYIVWWAVHQEEEPESGSDEDGGTKVNPRPDHRGRRPRKPRPRGPHGEPMPSAPSRSRTTIVRSRDPEHER